MKITMLGYTASGKTTYLSALLGLFYQGSVNGFSFRVPNERSHEVIALINRIDTLYKYGVFPEATSGSDIVNLNLQLFNNNTKLLDFEFIDYRGGALDEIAVNKNEQKVEELSTAILASDVVMIFVDSTKLKKCTNIMVARNYIGVLPITSVLIKAREQAIKSNKQIRVVFALTKTDASIITEYDIINLKTRLKQIFSNLYLQFGNESNEFKIFDVGCVGKGCVDTDVDWIITERNTRALVSNNTITKMEFKPFNIASVFVQSLLEGIQNTNYNTEIMSKILNEKTKKFNYIRQLIDILFNKSRRRLEIYDINNILEQNRKEIIKLQTYKSQFEEIIRNRK